MTNEEAIEILLDMRKGSVSCLAAEHPNNKEDVAEWQNEIDAIDTVINNYNREKARADKLEKDYSKSLTKIDELESDNYECNNIIREYIEDWRLKTKMIELMLEELTDCEVEMKCSECCCECEKDYDQLYECNKQYFENKAKESGEIDED